MNESLVCWKCGASLAELPLPLSRRAECLACHAEQHVCRLCRFYDTSVAKACREPVAEEVQDKTRANFCGYFEPRPNAYTPAATGAADTGRAGLEALFDLKGGAGAGAPAQADAARAELERLFGLADKKE